MSNKLGNVFTGQELILLRGELDILAETKGKLDKLAEKEVPPSV